MYDLIAGQHEGDDQVAALNVMRKKESDMGATSDHCKIKCSWFCGFYVRAGVIDEELRKGELAANFWPDGLGRWLYNKHTPT
jgi:hypothetical protein